MPEISEDNIVRLNVGECITANDIPHAGCYEIWRKIVNVEFEAWEKLNGVFAIAKTASTHYMLLIYDFEATAQTSLPHRLLYKAESYPVEKIRIVKVPWDRNLKTSNSESDKTVQWLERWRKRNRSLHIYGN